jgi:branched-chain amino acid transport system permease protein
LGELSLGHAGFMCIGAFSSALFSLGLKDSIANEGVRFFFAILIAAACAALCGILVGIPVLRLKGDYLAIRLDDLQDMYIIRREVFERTYELKTGE